VRGSISNLGANVLHYGTFLDMVHPGNGHCNPRYYKIFKAWEQLTNFIHHLLSK
jgi:hypothetical protein